MSVPSDSNIINNNVTVNSVSYKYEAWACLVLLFAFVVAYILKKPMTITHTTNSAPVEVHTPQHYYTLPSEGTGGAIPHFPSTTSGHIDMSGVQDINITNQKL